MVVFNVDVKRFKNLKSSNLRRFYKIKNFQKLLFNNIVEYLIIFNFDC